MHEQVVNQYGITCKVIYKSELLQMTYVEKPNGAKQWYPNENLQPTDLPCCTNTGEQTCSTQTT